MELIQSIRKLEADIIKDIKTVNALIGIRKIVRDNSSNIALIVAALHSQRYILIIRYLYALVCYVMHLGEYFYIF